MYCATIPVVALLACEALQMVNIALRSHHHLEGRNHFIAGRAVTGRAEQSETKKSKFNKINWCSTTNVGTSSNYTKLLKEEAIYSLKCN